ncbi:MAG: hypothetical protein F4X03_13575 [Dehalococcoidia bacterium]|nr:hypothetical protein [Dehalococcoidia bacterium]
MHEHEVPTHVQAEDHVLLWFTFPQIVALTAVAALAYGAYSLAPFGPAGVRVALAILIGLVGTAAIVGKIGGRRLPLVVADLLRFWLGSRRYAGTSAELGRSEPPPPPPPTPNPLQLLAKRTRRGLRRLRKKRRRSGRKPFRAHGRLGKRLFRRRGESGAGHRVDIRSLGRRMGYALLAASIGVTTACGVMALASQPASADGHDQWFEEEVLTPESVPGQRLFLERLTVYGDRAGFALRAATDLDVQVRAYGGDDGQTLVYQAKESLFTGERRSWDVPLDGDFPSVTVSWQDGFGEAGAFGLEGAQLPHPLPTVEGELCSLSMTSLSWSPGRIEGGIASTCVTNVEERVELPVVSGHHTESVTALIEAAVSGLSGTLMVTSGAYSTSVALVPDGNTAFRLSIESGAGIQGVSIETALEATTTSPLPALVELTHHPERTEQLTETASVTIPAFGDTVTETITVTGEDGTPVVHSVTASCHVPQSIVRQDVVFTVIHEEHVRAEVVARAPLVRARSESLALALSVASDDPYAALGSQEPEEEEPLPSTQTAVDPEVLQWLLGIINGQ